MPFSKLTVVKNISLCLYILLILFDLHWFDYVSSLKNTIELGKGHKKWLLNAALGNYFAVKNKMASVFINFMIDSCLERFVHQNLDSFGVAW